MLLAIDTSTSSAALALIGDDGAPEVELNWRVGQRHSAELLRRLDDVLGWRGVAPDALSAVAVALGPGSFNGVRVALATGKSLAFGLGVPLVGVPTLDVIAWGHALAGGTLWAVLEAGRGQVYAARYVAAKGPETSPTGWAPAAGPTAYEIVTPAEVGTRIAAEGAPALVCGEWRDETRSAIAEAADGHAHFAAGIGGRRGAWLADLALARLAAGQYDEPKTLEPLYLRRPAITSPKAAKVTGTTGDAASGGDEARTGEGELRAVRD